jgi:soluble lytic murein transglycosylase-like protein
MTLTDIVNGFLNVADTVATPLAVGANLASGRGWNQGLPKVGGFPNGKPFISPLADSKPGNFNAILGAKKPTPTPSPIPTPTPPPDKGALPYYLMINEEAKKNQIPQDIFYRLLKQESSFNPDTIFGRNTSPAGAQGIAQFMPATAQGMGIDPLNPDEAIPASAKYLRAKYDEGGDDWALALARNMVVFLLLMRRKNILNQSSLVWGLGFN